MPGFGWGHPDRRAGLIRFTAGQQTSSIQMTECAATALRERLAARPCLMVVDATVWRRHRNRLEILLLESPGPRPSVVLLKGGEAVKTPDRLTELWRRFARAGLSRDGVVVGIGGGTILDLAGLAAATWMRGVTLMTIPTTLLAAVDASIGGKTAIDLDGLKNPVGAFHAATNVLVDPDLLSTLPRREWRCGLAELVKIAVIGDPALFRSLEDAAPRLQDLLTRGRAEHAVPGITTLPWDEWIEAAVLAKARIVAADFRERGPRRALNLGHTLAHALEPLLDIPHGEAVALGLAAVSRAAVDQGICAKRTSARINDLLTACGLSTRCTAPPIGRVTALVNRDKKKAGGTLNWVLPARIGRVLIDQELDLKHVLSRLSG